MKWLRNTVVAAIALLASCLPAPAQSPVTVVGAVQPGHCVSFFSTTQIQDTGAGCGLGGGGVSSVGLSLPVNTFSVTGSPVTTSGTLVGSLINQSANTFFAGPSTGVPTSPTWRALTSTDLPLISPAQGGTGLANPTAHSLLIAEGAANFNLITATSAGRMILDQGSGLDWAAVAMSADCTLIATGAITCTKTNGTAFGTFATQNFATPPAIGGTTPNAGTFSTLSAASITDTGITGSTQCLQVNSAGLISGIGAACSAVGPVSSVSNADGTVTISPTTGNVIASLALGHANTWTSLQTFSSAISTSAITDTGITGLTQCVQASATGVLSGTGAACGSGSGAVNSVTNADGTLTISPTTGAVVASLNLAHANTWTATQTISGASFSITGNQSAPSWTTHGIRYVNVPATLTDTSATGTVAAQYTGFFGGNTIAASNAVTFTNYYEYYYTAPIAGANVTFSNSWALGADSLRVAGNATIAGALTINTLSSPLSLANGGTNASLTASNGGIIYSTASAFAVLAGTVTSGQCLLSGSSAAPTWGSCPGAVASVSNADGTLTISPTTGVVVASLALGHANTWTAVQTHNNNSIALLGSSTGSTTFSSANAGASNFTATFPANTGTIAELNLAQTFSASQTFSSTLTFSGVAGGSQVSCLGLTAANLVAISAGACGTATGGGNTPTKQVFLTGSGTYTSPANVRWIDIILVGGGGGGGGSEGSTGIGGAGGVGGNTCWNTTGAACTSPVYQAGGGTAGTASSSQGPVSGGTVSGSGTCDYSVAGGDGSGGNTGSTISHTGGLGGVSIFGGNGAAGGTFASLAPSANSGSGGAGGSGSAGNGGGGGAAGAACRVIISAPAATYTYAVGAAGTAGAAGTGINSNAGTVGAAGVIIVYEYYGASGSNPAGANSNVQFNNSGAFGGNAGFTYDATSLIGLGVAGTSVGKVQLFNATSGSITLQPTTGALGAVTATLPANTGTVAEINLAQTWTATQTFAAISATAVTDTALASAGTQCVQANTSGVLSGTGSACGAGGGAVSSVSNADGTLTISPTTGAVVASLNLGNANTWTAIQTFTNSDIKLLGSSTGATTFTSANAGASNFTATVPANTGTLAELNLAQTWTAAQSFTNADLIMLGATSGQTTLQATAVAGATTATFPANTGTVAELNLAQTWTAVQTHNSGNLVVAGATSGTLTINCAATCGANTITFPAGTTNFSATGGAAQYLKQTSAGGAITVGTIAAGDITPAGSTTQVQYNSSGAFGASAGFVFDGTSKITLGVAGTSVGGVAFANATSGTITLNPATGALGAVTATLPANTGTIAEINLAQTFSAAQTFSSSLTFSGVTTGTQVSCLGLTAANLVATSTGACGSGGGGTPGGSTGQVQYNNASAFGGIASFTNGTSIFALGNTSTAQQFIVYNTVDTISGPTNYERAVFDWTTTANVLTIGTQAGGTGTTRNLQITVGGNIKFDFGVSQTNQTSVSGQFVNLNSQLQANTSNGNIIIGSGNGLNFGSSGFSYDVGLSRAAAKVLAFGDGGGNTNGWMQWAGEARVTSDFTVTSSTALTNVTGLSVNVQAGRTYRFETELFVTDAAAGGVQAAIAGTATATAIQYTGFTIADNAIKGKANATALATAYGSTTTTETAGIIVRATGTITVNAAGTLTVQMAQNTSNATATTAKRGSYLIAHDMP